MPFKIIETIERGRRLIVTVPSLWESDGNLYWPRKNVMPLKKNEKSAPQSDWKCLPCILLRDNIFDYKTAEQEIALMSDATDTDNKENERPRKNTLAINLNNLVMECIQESKVAKEASPKEAAEDASSVMVVTDSCSTIETENVSSVMVAEDSSSTVATDDVSSALVAKGLSLTMATEHASPAMVAKKNLPSIVATEEASSVIMVKDSSSTMVVEPNALIPTEVNNILIQDLSQKNTDNYNSSCCIQDNMLQLDENLLLPELDQHLHPQFADPQTTITESIQIPEEVGYFIEMASAIQENQKVLFENQQKMLKGLALLSTKLDEFFMRSHPFQPERHEQSSHFKMITNIKELTAFEEQLKDPLMETKYLKELSIICSEKKTGHNNAYALVDAMFDRKFMTRCSWGGGTKGEPKHCFKAFQKTIDLFLKVLHQHDKTFTKPICEDFFKNVMRHSKKRNTAKRVRNSTTKKKIKKCAVENNLQDENRPGPSNVNNSTL